MAAPLKTCHRGTEVKCGGYYSSLNDKWYGFDQDHSIKVLRNMQVVDIWIYISKIMIYLEYEKHGKNKEGRCQAARSQAP